MKLHTIFLGMALACATVQPACAAVFFAAHPDDIVLMMGRNVQNDIKGNHPTVIVVLTAGDAGNGDLAATMTGMSGHQYNQMGNPYYRVRHNAHEAAIGLWVPAFHSRIPVRSTEYFGPDITAVEKVAIGKVVMYHLNLPDALLDAFHAGRYKSLADVTGVNVYTPASLRETLRQIISRNNRNVPTVVINLQEHTPEFSMAGYNEDKATTRFIDHPDHTAAGRFVRDAVDTSPAHACVYRAVYMGYAIIEAPERMTEAEKQSQIAAFTALNEVLKNQGNITYNADLQKEHLGTMDAFHMSFYGKQLWRDSGGGSSTCAF